MARKSRSKDPMAAVGEIVVSLAAAIGFLAWFSPSFWDTIKPFVIGGGVLAVAGIAYVFYRKLNAPPTGADQSTQAPERPTAASRRAYKPARQSREPSQPQPSPALEKAISAAMEAGSKPPAPEGPREFNKETLARMDWLGFEHLVVDLFNELGFHAKKTQAGADGGVDIELRAKNAAPHEPAQALVQCKARSSSLVGVEPVRGLLGVITANSVSKGILITNSGVSKDAQAFADANPQLLIGDIAWILKNLAKFPEEKRKSWEAKHLGDGFDVPSCVACETKMRIVNTFKDPFWGCPNYSTPKRCKTKLNFKKFDHARIGVA